MAAWSGNTLKFCKEFLRFFGKTTPYGNFLKFCSERFYRFTDRYVMFVFCEISLQEIGEIVRCLPDKRTKISPGSTAIATGWIAPKICQRQLPTMYTECSRFHSNRFTFDGVVAERVNTAKTRRKVNPIFGWSLASSRIIDLRTDQCRKSG